MTRIIPIAIALACLAACGPRPGSDPLPGGVPQMTCGGAESLGGALLDPDWQGNVILEPVDLDCRWEGSSFPMYRRAHDGALFYRPLFKVAEPPRVDELDDSSGRTLMFDLVMAVPDPEAACRTTEGGPTDLPVDTARPLPLTNAKLKLESPVASSVCEMGDGQTLAVLGDEEWFRVKLEDADAAERVEGALALDPSLLALRVYWQSVGSLRAIRCTVVDEGLKLLEKWRIESDLRSAGLTPLEDGETWLLGPDGVKKARGVVTASIVQAIQDFGPFSCSSEILGEVVAAELLQSWQTGTQAGDDGVQLVTVKVADVTRSWLVERIGRDAPLMPVAGEEVVRGGCCSVQCEGCCDERADCLGASQQTEQRCGTGEPGKPCTSCPSDEICKDGKCWRPPYMEGSYEVSLVAVDVDGRCGLMEVGGCDLDVGFRLPGEEQYDTFAGPDNANHVQIVELMLTGADAQTAMEGFDVTLSDRDPFSDDFLGSCTVSITNHHLAQAFKDPGGAVFFQPCQKSWVQVGFKVQLTPQ